MTGSMAGDLNPVFGIIPIPCAGVGFTQTRAMDPKTTLAQNLKKLMEVSPALDTFPKIIEAGGGTNGTLDRIRRAESAAGIDKLEPLARVFGLQAWQLLVPTLVARRGLRSKPVVGGLPDWPFSKVDRARFDALPQDERSYIEGKLDGLIDDAEGRSGKRNAA